VSRHILWLEAGRLARTEGTICLVHAMLGELEDGGVQLLAQFLLSVRVNCRRGAFVGIQGDSLQGLSSHVPSRFGGLCLQQWVRVCASSAS
jgi:hypothetical protein